VKQRLTGWFKRSLLVLWDHTAKIVSLVSIIALAALPAIWAKLSAIQTETIAIVAAAGLVGGLIDIFREPGRGELKRERAELENARDKTQEDYHKFFLRTLEEQYHRVGLNNLDRVSIYKRDGNQFVHLARYSDSEAFRTEGRQIYPANQGIFRDSWTQHQNIPIEQSRRFAMKSRHVVGCRVDSPTTGPVGLLVFESVRSEPYASHQVGQFRRLATDFAIAIDQMPMRPQLGKAKREGY
jgi:bifunctional DNA-binding transcriptional regulator/antitoxin component of YhaV-PrlF toxin-antitoxin module